MEAKAPFHDMVGPEVDIDYDIPMPKVSRPRLWSKPLRGPKMNIDVKDESDDESMGLMVEKVLQEFLFSHTIIHEKFETLLKGEHAAKWAEAVKEEITSLEEVQTWKEVEPSEIPPNTRILNTRFHFTEKDFGTPRARFKARLIAVGCLQPTSTYDSFRSETCPQALVRLCLIYGLERGWDPASIDIKNAYVQSKLDVPIYCYIPEIPTMPGKYGRRADGRRRCFRLYRSLYGLKQSGLMWARYLHDKLRKVNFERCGHPCVYRRRLPGKQGWEVVVTYVDDL